MADSNEKLQALHDAGLLDKMGEPIRVTEEDGREVKTAIQKAGSATLWDLNSYSELEGALAMIRATAVDARHYLAIQKQIEAAAIKIYREGWDDGSGFVLEAIREEDLENEPRS